MGTESFGEVSPKPQVPRACLWGSTAWPLFWGVALASILLGIPVWRMAKMMNRHRFDDLILRAAGENGCDPSLVKAVVWRETGFNPAAKGEKGELGLMQVMPNVALEWAQARGEKTFDPDRLLDPSTNLRVGTWYLSRAIQQWAHAAEPVPLALAQYNAGRKNVLNWADANSLADADHFINRIQFPSTRAYVRDILHRYQNYRRHGEF